MRDVLVAAKLLVIGTRIGQLRVPDRHRGDTPLSISCVWVQTEGAHAAMPNDQVLRWAASAVDGTRVVSTESLSRGDHRPSGTFRLRVEGPAARATDVILKVPRSSLG